MTVGENCIILLQENVPQRRIIMAAKYNEIGKAPVIALTATATPNRRVTKKPC